VAPSVVIPHLGVAKGKISVIARNILIRWLGGLEVRCLPRDRKVAGSILTSGGGIFEKYRIRDLS
jgi:hypothetical protein